MTFTLPLPAGTTERSVRTQAELKLKSRLPEQVRSQIRHVNMVRRDGILMVEVTFFSGRETLATTTPWNDNFPGDDLIALLCLIV